MAYSQEIADAICARLADGESLRSITKDVGASQAEVFRWLADEANVSFREQYARAREAQADHYAGEIIDIADEECTMVKRDDGGEVEVVFDSTAVARNRLRVDARKWYASKLAPKKYGDRITQEHTGEGGGPVQIVASNHDEAL
jgi:hypothetical protein